MSGPMVADAEHGLVAIEWPTADIAAEYLTVEATGILLTAARKEAHRLGLTPNDGAAMIYTVQRQEGDCLRFVWGDALVPR